MKNIFLDLDNTIICAEPFEDITDPMKFKERASHFDFKNMEDYYLICARPFLQSFLDYLFTHFKVHIWTAASKGYASFIVEEFILKKNPSRKINLILFDRHCRVCKRTYKQESHSKKLEILWDIWKQPEFDKDNTFIIDDLKEVKDCQINNCINVKPFEFLRDDSEYDKELIKIKDILNDIK